MRLHVLGVKGNSGEKSITTAPINGSDLPEAKPEQKYICSLAFKNRSSHLLKYATLCHLISAISNSWAHASLGKAREKKNHLISVRYQD